MFGWLLNITYLLLIASLSPVLLRRRLLQGKYRDGWRQKFWGDLPVRSSQSRKRVWIHAVSVGEILQLPQLLSELRRRVADAEILVSTTTQTGYQVARDKLKDVEIAYFPLDFTWAVRRAIDRVQPDLVVLVELEIWPNFIRQLSRKSIPIAIVNGRLSERSFRGYRRIRPLIRRLLQSINRIACQTDEYAARFLDLGCRPGSVSVTGSIKFDGVDMSPQVRDASELGRFFQLDTLSPVIVAGSTQAPEEGLILDVYESLLRVIPGLQLVIAPRHPERGHEVANLIANRGFMPVRRSMPAVPELSGPKIGLLDTVGELKVCWALADVAFVGGSFGNRGGQNMLEPAALGLPTCFGPNTRNFRQIVELLSACDGARTVGDRSELEQFLEHVFQNRAEANAMGLRAQQLIRSQQGATLKTVELIARLLVSGDAEIKRAA